MKKISSLILLLIAALLTNCSGSKETVIKFNWARRSSPISAEEFRGTIYFVTQDSLFRKENKSFKSILGFSGKITSLLHRKDKLYIGTTKGLFSYNGKQLDSLQIPADNNYPKIAALAKDLFDNLWIGTDRYGGYKLNDTKIEQSASIYPITSIACTNDSSVWFGSNIGLHRLKNNVWKRYHEEGTIGLEVPDNIIEYLYADSKSNLWVLSSGPATILDINSKEEHNDIATFDFLGENGNSIYKVKELTNGKYLAVCKKGIVLFNPVEHEHDHRDLNEVHSKINEKSKGITRRKDLLIPEFLKNDDEIIILEDSNNIVWFFSRSGIWSVSESKLTREES